MAQWYSSMLSMCKALGLIPSVGKREIERERGLREQLQKEKEKKLGNIRKEEKRCEDSKNKGKQNSKLQEASF